MDRPVLAQLFVAGKDFLREEVNAAPVVGHGLVAHARAAVLHLGEIAARIVQAVRVVDAQAGDFFVRDQGEEEFVDGVEHGGHLDADGRELVDVEKPAVVDFLGGHAPEAQPVGLRLDELVQPVEGTRLARLSLEMLSWRG